MLYVTGERAKWRKAKNDSMMGIGAWWVGNVKCPKDLEISLNRNPDVRGGKRGEVRV